MSAAAKIAVVEKWTGGAPPRHIDYETAQLDKLARAWIDVQQTRMALTQRDLDDKIVEPFAKGEQALSGALKKALRAHPLWPWLAQFPGLGGAHTALLIGRIGDPRRYPGQRCTEGHYLPPGYPVGAPCPIAVNASVSATTAGDGASLDAGTAEPLSESEKKGGCPGVMLPPRPHSGVRSVWHWAGLHAVNGESPRKRKGVQCDWEPRARSSVMQPGGIAEQIVRQNVPHYADIYRAAKARLTLRVADELSESEDAVGDAILLRPADLEGVIVVPHGRPLRLFQADRTARKIAAKVFVGDLLTEWKGLSA